MQAFWIAAGFVFLAEMGDKTQLVSLAFAARYPARIVLAAVFVATLLAHLFSVTLGESAALLLSRFWIDLLAGAAFLGFAVWTVRGDQVNEKDMERGHAFGPFMRVGTTFFMAELGDKTMLATVTIASQHRQFVAVWIGSTVGMVAADGLAILLGNAISARLSERTIRYIAAAVFFGSGIYTVIRAVAGF